MLQAYGPRLVGFFCFSRTGPMSDLSTLEQRAQTELEACADETALRGWHTRSSDSLIRLLGCFTFCNNYTILLAHQNIVNR